MKISIVDPPAFVHDPSTLRITKDKFWLETFANAAQEQPRKKYPVVQMGFPDPLNKRRFFIGMYEKNGRVYSLGTYTSSLRGTQKKIRTRLTQAKNRGEKIRILGIKIRFFAFAL